MRRASTAPAKSHQIWNFSTRCSMPHAACQPYTVLNRIRQGNHWRLGLAGAAGSDRNFRMREERAEQRPAMDYQNEWRRQPDSNW
jgi:hypothetical protein